jgi:hypothetical protein
MQEPRNVHVHTDTQMQNTYTSLTAAAAALALPVPASVVTSSSPWKVSVIMLRRLGLPPAGEHTTRSTSLKHEMLLVQTHLHCDGHCV